MTRLIAPRAATVIGDLRDPDVDREAVERYHHDAGVRRARASIAAEEAWLDRHGTDRRAEGPLGYALIFLLVVMVTLWIIA